MAQPTWAQIETALYNAIASASGVTCAWAYQNVDAPAYPYVRMTMGAIAPVGTDSIVESTLPAWAEDHDYDATDLVLNDGGNTYVCTQAGTSSDTGPTGTGTGIVDGTCLWDYVEPGSEIAQTLLGLREVALQLEGFTGSSSSITNPSAGLVETSGATARALLDKVSGKLLMPSIRTALAAVGVTPFDAGTVNWIPDVVSTGFRGRATLDVRCYMPARAVAEYTSYIARMTWDVTAEGAPGGTITETIEAP